MKPEAFVAVVKEVYDENLVSVTLYGSAAAGDYVGKSSDYNLLVILQRLEFAELKQFTDQVVKWSRQGNPPPLLFTQERLSQSADVFPIEIMDMKQSRRVLYGEDVLADLKVSDTNLRLQIEHELRSKLIALREQYLLTRGRSKALKELMIQSLSSFLVLFRATLRLFACDVPGQKMDALRALSGLLHFDVTPFEQINELKQGQSVSEDMERLFEKYLNTIVAVIDMVDAKILSE